VLTVDPLHLTLPATPESIGAARRALAPLREDVGDPVYRDLRLLVSEVVTNAIRHAEHRGEVRLVVVPVPGALRVEVHDGGVGFAPDPEPTPAADRGAGWGLYLVDKLTRSWGAERAPDAHVWFELEH
jgi:anti-sigma regulatory factor (Ser/Thr protein kinase)